MRLVEIAQEEANQRVVLCDLNWTRLVHMRLAAAQFFDSPAGQDHLANLQRVEIAHGPGCRSTAILLAGWLAAQLGWTLVEAADETTLGFSDCAGEAIRVTLEETAGDPIVRCSLFCGAVEFRVVDPPDTDLLEVTVRVDDRVRMHQLMPAGQNNPVALMREELMRGGPHRVYLRALEAVRALL
jgi:glucose-6-phosphate dehydrogenase assembly protein OpcA